MAEKLASAYVELHPWLASSFSKDLSKQMGGADYTGAGEKAGQQFSGGLSKNVLSNASKTFDKAGSFLTKGITIPALTATTTVGGIFAAKGWGRLEQIDTAKSKLTGLGYTGAEIEGIMDSALASVKGTAYGLGDAATVAVGALASGVQQGDQLTQTLKTMADVATIAGGDFTGVATVFNKVMSKGKLQGDEILQLSERGVPVLQIMAKHLGITAEEAQKMASDGEISFAAFEQAMRESFGGAALASGESMRGTIENVWAAVGRVGAAFLDSGDDGEGFFSRLKPFLGEFTQNIDAMTDTASEWGSRFAEAFGQGIKFIKGLTDAYNKLTPHQQESIVQLGGIAVAAGPVFKVFSKITSGASMLGAGLQKVIGVSSGMQAKFSSLTSFADSGSGTWTKYTKTVQDSSGAIVNWGKTTQGCTTTFMKWDKQTQSYVKTEKGLGAALATSSVGLKAQAAASNISTKAMKLQAAGAKALGSTMKSIAPLAIISGIIALGTAIGDNIKKQQEYVQATDGLRSAAMGASDAFNQAAGSGIVNYKTKLAEAVTAVDTVTQKQAALAESIREANTKAYGDVSMLENYRQTIENLTSSYESTGERIALTTDEQAKLQLAVEGLNKELGTNYQVVDAVNGIIADEAGNTDNVTQSIYRQIEAMKLKLQIEALQDQYKSALQSQTEAQEAHTKAVIADKDAKQAQKQAEEQYAEACKNGEANLEGYATAVIGAKDAASDAAAKLNEARGNLDAANDTVGALDARMTFLQKTIDGNASEWESFMARTPEVSGIFQSLGKDVSDLASDLAACGVDQESFANLSADQIATLAEHYNGSIASIIGDLNDMDLCSNTTLQQIASDSSLMSSRVTEAFSNAGVSQDEFIAKVANSGIAVSDFKNLSSEQLTLLVEAYASNNGEIQGKLNEFVEANRVAGSQGSAELAAQMDANQPVVLGSATNLSNAATEAVASLPEEMKQTGAKTSEDFAKSLIVQEFQAQQNANQMADAAAQMGRDKDSGSVWGNHLAGGFVGSLRSHISLAGSAASSIANAVSRFLHFTHPDEGPLKSGTEIFGRHLVQDFAKGMRRDGHLMKDSAEELMAGVESCLSAPIIADISARSTSSIVPIEPNSSTSKEVSNTYIIDGLEVSGSNPDDTTFMESVFEYVFKRMSQARMVG